MDGEVKLNRGAIKELNAAVVEQTTNPTQFTFYDYLTKETGTVLVKL